MKLLRTSGSLTRMLLLTTFSILSVACSSQQADITVLDESKAENVPAALGVYSQAWIDRDTDKILQNHTEDSEFNMVVFGSKPARGKAEIKLAFDAIFASNPNYRSSVKDVRFGDDFAVVEYDIHMDPNRAVQAGTTVLTPSGIDYQVPAIDIIVFKDGLVTQKTTYLDTETIRAHSVKVEQPALK